MFSCMVTCGREDVIWEPQQPRWGSREGKPEGKCQHVLDDTAQAQKTPGWLCFAAEETSP